MLDHLGTGANVGDQHAVLAIEPVNRWADRVRGKQASTKDRCCRRLAGGLVN